MDLELNEDQAELHAVAAQMLNAECPLSVARDYLHGARDATDLWAIVADLGWYAVGATDDDPFGAPGLCILAQQAGAHVAPIPLVDTAVVTSTAARSEGASEALAELAAGERTAAVCVVEDRSGWTLEPAEAQLACADGSFTLDAQKLGVQHAASVDFLAVLAGVDGEPALALTARDAPGIEITSTPSLDVAAAASRVSFDTVVVPAGQVVRDRRLVERAMRLGAVATAAEGIGAASAALDLAVQYARERRQFGRPIGTFQSIQHILADAHVARESAWATVLYAAAVLDAEAEDAADAVAIAKAYGSRAARETVEAALQVLGGIGFTWEHDAHLFQRRALECERRFGDPLQHERTIADYLRHAARVAAQ